MLVAISRSLHTHIHTSNLVHASFAVDLDKRSIPQPNRCHWVVHLSLDCSKQPVVFVCILPFPLSCQVTLLANGRLMFHGPREDMVEWFGSLGYVHNPLEHGVASDWALDLVAVGFAKPAKYYGHTMRNKEDLAAASKAFKDHYMRVSREPYYAVGWQLCRTL